MIILNVEQGTPEWNAARCGLPTASNFDKIVTAVGVPSKQREKYLFQLAGERVAGCKEEAFQNGAMQRGVEMEAEARQLYELNKEVEVQRVGICYPDEKKLVGCSPDGLVGEDGGLEIKCPSLAVHVCYLLEGRLPSDYIQQVQGNLYVTGRKWWDFMSYFPGIKPLIIRVERDEKFIKSLAVEIEVFCKQLDEIVEKIR